MIYSAIYKLKIKKETEKLYNLWGQQLITLQERYIKSISLMLGRWYKLALAELKNNTEASYNEVFIDQKQFMSKEISWDDFKMFSKMLKEWFNAGAKQLNSSFKKDVKIDTSFSIDPADSLKYANQFAWSKIKGIDDYSRARIKSLITQGLDKGWGYNKLAKELKLDYSFSTYRARLIASQEIWEAYLSWKQTQFERYTRRYNEKGWKHWVSHRDSRTTGGCLWNDYQWWIPADQNFESGHERPTRFPWCRCNCVYRLFDPRDQWDTLTPDNAEETDTIQSTILQDDQFDDGIKPIWYDKHSTWVLPAKYFNAIWKQAEYITPKGRAYYQWAGDKINVWVHADEWTKQYVEVHEVGHFFFTRKVLKDETNFAKFKAIYKASAKEMKELIKDKILRHLFNPHNWVHEIWKALFDKYSEIARVSEYTVDVSKLVLWSWREIDQIKLSPQYQKQIWSFMDTIGALNKEASVGWWHGKSYYKNSITVFTDGLSKVSEKQCQEYFAHLNESYWIGNPIIETLLPETYNAMKEFYKEIGYEFI